MRFLNKIFIFVLVLLVHNKVYSNIDSLNQLLKKPLCSDNKATSNCLNDSIAFYTYINLGLLHLDNNVDTAIYYHKEAIKIADKTNNLYLKSIAFDNLGWDYHKKNDYNTSLDYYKKGILIIEHLIKKTSEKKSIHFLITKSTINGHMATTYRDQGYYDKALALFFESLKIDEKYGSKTDEAITLGSIGLIYWDLQNYSKSKQYALKSIEIQKELNHIEGLGNSYTNLGILSFEEEKYDDALDFYYKAIEIFQNLKDFKKLGIVLSNIALLHKYNQNYDKAIEYYLQALKVSEQVNSKTNLTLIYGNLGILYVELKNYKEGEKYITKSFKIATELGSLDDIKQAHDYYTALYDQTNRPALAFKHYQIFIQMRDSLFNIENTKASIARDLQYNFDKKALSDSIDFAKENEIKEVQISKQKAEIKAKQNQQIALYSGLILVIVFAGFMYNRFKITKKQKLVIEEQKAIVESSHNLLEEKNKEITDSIQYAKRIQNAILPPSKIVKEYLPQSFILYKPKDIVAGDFYWMEHKNDKILFAAADCTGHGVPGAMVSVICNNGLNRSVRELGLTEPGKILDKTREIVIQEFEKSDDEVKDGMDISLCELDLKNNILNWSGANNPIWIVRNGELLETKADKQPIGKYAEEKPFTTHTFELQPNDSIYIFTDGFHDQFGGAKGKKFKASPMKELILSIQDKNMDEQKDFINNTFENWKGKLDQVDDVCVIGVKI